MGYQISNEADEDLIEIFLYSLASFSAHQAEAYIRDIYNSFTLLPDNPKFGRIVDELGFNIRKYVHNKHSIFYKIENDTILILRVLHHSKDVHAQDF